MFVVAGEVLLYGVGPVVEMGWFAELLTKVNYVCSPQWNGSWLMMWAALLLMVHFTVPVPFIFRYLLLSRGRELSTRQYILLFSASIIPALVVFTPAYFLNMPTEQRQREIELAFFGGAHRPLGFVDVGGKNCCTVLSDPLRSFLKTLKGWKKSNVKKPRNKSFGHPARLSFICSGQSSTPCLLPSVTTV